MRASSNQASPHYLSGPHISWLLLTLCYTQSLTLEPGQSELEDLDGGPEIDTYLGLDENVATDLAVYLVKCWDGNEPPPASLQELCTTLEAHLFHGEAIRSQVRSGLVATQIHNITTWLAYQWEFLGTGGIPSVASGWLVKIIDSASACLDSDQLQNDAVRIPNRRSPLGVPIRRMRLAHEGLDEMKDLTHLAKVLQRWRDRPATQASTSNFKSTIDNDGDDDDDNDEEDEPSSIAGRPGRIEVYAAYQDARKRGDYLGARENLSKFFELAPIYTGSASSSSAAGPPVRKTKIHPHALLNFAALQVENHEWAAAEQTLHETIQLARTERDEGCLQACQSLERRIKTMKMFEDPSDDSDDGDGGDMRQGGLESSWRAPGHSVYSGHLSLDDLWDIQTAARSGAPIDDLLGQIETVLTIPMPTTTRPGGHTHQGPQVATGEPARTKIAQDRTRPWATAAALAASKGDVAAADRYRHLYRHEPYQGDEERRERDELAMRFQEAWQNAEAGEYDAAMARLIDPLVIETMSLADYHDWTRAIWSIAHLQRRRMGDAPAMSRISTLSPGIESVDLDMLNAPPYLKKLLVQAYTFVNAGRGKVALKAIGELVSAADAAGRRGFVIQGTLLECKVLMEQLGQYGRARCVLEDVMVLSQADHNLERRADVNAMYAQSLCGPDVSASDAATTTKAMEWYERALQGKTRPRRRDWHDGD